MNPAFHRSMPINTMSTVIPDLFSVIEKENGAIAVPSVMRNFTLDVLGLTVFGQYYTNIRENLVVLTHKD
jgi:hypothetical protein